MSYLRAAMRLLSRFGIIATDPRRELVPRINFSSAITPIKMDFQVFQSNATNPNAPALVVMHGFLGSKTNYTSICKGLEGKTKRKIYNVDARNHGKSPHEPVHSSAHISADVALLVREENLQRVSVLGHSMGGRAMMYFALQYPELVEKLIVVDISPISFPSNQDSIEKIFKAMKSVRVSPNLSKAEGKALAERQMMNILEDKSAVNFLMQNFKKHKTGEFGWRVNVDTLYANLSQFQGTQRITHMPPFTKPVLFIAGNRSKFMNPDDWPKIKNIFPNAELKWLDGGHLIHFTQPQKFMELVTDFLRH